MTAGLMFAGDFRLDSAIFAAARDAHFSVAGAAARTDSNGGGWQIGVGAEGPLHALRRARVAANTRTLDRLYQQRSDSFSVGSGYHMARDLEYSLSEVLEEKFPMPTAMELFPVSTEVPVGAETFMIRSENKHGKARIYSGGDLGQVPMMGRSAREETRNVRHIVAGYAINIWEAQADRYARRNRQANLARDTRTAILWLLNRAFWGKDNIAANHGIYGVLTYPWLPRKDMQIGVSAATVEANPDEVLRELHDLVNHPQERYQSVFYPDTLVLTNRVYNVLNQTKLTDGHPKTILQQFIDTTKHIKSIEVAWELENAGGAGVDGVLAYRRDQQGIELILPQGIDQLPIIEQGLQTVVVNHAACGGVLMRYPRNNVLGLWDTNA